EPCLGIEFLEGLFFAVLKWNQSHEEHQRGRILPSCMQADMGVGHSRTTGHHGNTGTLMHLAFSFSHVGGPAFMAANHGLDWRIMQSVQDIQVAFARYYVGAFHAVCSKRVDNDMSG